MSSEDELLTYLEGLTGLDRALLGKILEEVRAWYGTDPAAWIRRRHDQLQREGLANAEIYPHLRDELCRAVFSPGQRSDRQVRRMIYG